MACIQQTAMINATPISKSSYLQGQSRPYRFVADAQWEPTIVSIQ
jgi:hypothetical protein